MSDIKEKNSIEDILKNEIENFTIMLKRLQDAFKHPNAKIDKYSSLIKEQINENANKYLESMQLKRDELLSSVDQYKNETLDTLKKETQHRTQIEQVINNYERKMSVWNDSLKEKNINLSKLLFDVIEDKAKITDVTESYLFSLQRLYSIAHKSSLLFERDEVLSADDYFYVNIDRLKKINTVKKVAYQIKGCTRTYLISTNGGRFVLVMCVSNSCELHLLEVNPNYEITVVRVVSDSGIDMPEVIGSNKNQIIALQFDNYEYLKIYDMSLKEKVFKMLGDYKMHIYDKYLVFYTRTDNIKVFNPDLNEVDSSELNVNKKYFSNNTGSVLFKGRFLFIFDTPKQLKIIDIESDQLVNTLTWDNNRINCFYVDSLYRIIIYSEQVQKIRIIDMNGNLVHELECVTDVSSMCVTDNGLLVVSNYYGDLFIY